MSESETQVKIDTFFKQFPTVTFPAHHLCLRAGKTTEFFYFIESGAVKMTKLSAEGRDIVFHIFFPKSFFSLLSLASDQQNFYDFITLETTTIRKVPRSELLTFLQNNNDVLFDLQLRLLKGLNGLLKRIEQITSVSAYGQVASLLLYFSAHFAHRESTDKHSTNKLDIKITHQEIADWLGLSRENVSIQMKLLERNNFIKMHEHFIELIDRPGLINIAEPSGN